MQLQALPAGVEEDKGQGAGGEEVSSLEAQPTLRRKQAALSRKLLLRQHQGQGHTGLRDFKAFALGFGN